MMKLSLRLTLVGHSHSTTSEMKRRLAEAPNEAYLWPLAVDGGLLLQK